MEALTELIIPLIGIIVLARVSALLSKRFDMSSVTIQLLIGILLGPSLLNLLGEPIVLGTWGSPSPSPLHSVLKILGEIGLIQLMFLAGLQTDWHELKKKIRSSFSVGGWGFILTVASVTIITRVFMDRWAEALAMGAIMAASGFGISIYTMREMKLHETKASSLWTGVAILNGLLAILLMITSLTVKYGLAFGMFKATIAASWLLAKLTMFFMISYFLMSRFLNRIAKKGFEKRPRQMLIGYLLLVAALYAWAAMHFGSFAAVGAASLGGALLGMSDFGLREKISKGFESTMVSLPVGMLFVIFGMEVSIKEAQTSIIFLAVLLILIVVAKWMGSWIATRKVLDSSRDRMLTVFGILSQGEMGMLIAAYLFSRGLVNSSQFNIAIIVVLLLSMISPILMKIVGKLSLRGVPQCGRTKQSIEIASLRSQ
jgi:Kef-type K+ transport system membrane component KefB